MLATVSTGKGNNPAVYNRSWRTRTLQPDCSVDFRQHPPCNDCGAPQRADRGMSTECRQPAAWTTNWILLEASCANAFPRRPTNSNSTLPRAAHLEDGVITVFTSHSVSAPAFPNMQPTHCLCPACLPTTVSIPAPTQPTIAMAKDTHAPTVTNLSAFRVKLQR